jgi:hypothetical protein
MTYTTPLTTVDSQHSSARSMTKLNEYAAALKTGMSPWLLQWFGSNRPKQGERRHLPNSRDARGDLYYEEDDLAQWTAYLQEPWPEER